MQAEAKRSTTANAIVAGAGQSRTVQPPHFALSPSSTSGLPGAAILHTTTNITPSLVLSTQTEVGAVFAIFTSLLVVQGSGRASPSTRSTRRLQLREISLLLESYPVSSLRYSTIYTASTAFEKVPCWLLGLRDRSSYCLHCARCASDLET